MGQGGGNSQQTQSVLRDKHTGLKATSTDGGFPTKAGLGELVRLFYFNGPWGSLSQPKAGGFQPWCQLRTSDRDCVRCGRGGHIWTQRCSDQ